MHATNFQQKPHKWEIVEVITFEGCCYSTILGLGWGCSGRSRVWAALMVSILRFDIKILQNVGASGVGTPPLPPREILDLPLVGYFGVGRDGVVVFCGHKAH